MPRKYRPPSARRRKSKRTPPLYVEPLPEDGDSGAPVEDAVSTIEPAQATASRPKAPPGEPVAAASDRSAGPAARHLTRDYSYVRAEVRRIAFVAGFLIISLIVTALLRN